MRRLRPGSLYLLTTVAHSCLQSCCWTDQVCEALLVWPAPGLITFSWYRNTLRRTFAGEKNIVFNGIRISDRKKSLDCLIIEACCRTSWWVLLWPLRACYFPPYSQAPRSPHMRSRPMTTPGGISYLKPDASSSRSSSAWRRNAHPHPDSTPPQVSRTGWWSVNRDPVPFKTLTACTLF